MNELQIKLLQKLYAEGKIIWTDHIHRRLQERETSRDDIYNVLFKGKIIEQYPDDFPHPSCLISGEDLGGQPLHIVVACSGSFVTMVTVYYPDLDTFESDYETRREK